MLLFSISVHIISSPQFRRPALPPSLIVGLIRLLFTGSSSLDHDFLCRARSSFSMALLVFVSAASGFVSVVSIAGSSFSGSFAGLISTLGFRGFGVGLIYGVYCVSSHRWVLNFPIVQVR
ncbi:30S ribosomal protein S13 [Bienertia sinuspersici]